MALSPGTRLALGGLERQPLILEEIGQVGFPLFATSDERPLMISGECYAYEWKLFSENSDVPWHWKLMRTALVALDKQRGRRPIVAGYELMQGMVRLFLCAAQDLRLKRGTHPALARVPGYLECGRDAVATAKFRPVAYWEFPTSLVALWPLPTDGRPGPYALDAGNLLSFRSYPESDHEQGLALDLAGPDYLRVPTIAEELLDPEGVRYVNRWAELVLLN